MFNQGTSYYQRYNKSEEHEVLREAWATYLGVKEGISKNIRDALDLSYYDQLSSNMVG